MSKKSRKVVDKTKINELLNQKGQQMLGESFEGIGGIVPLDTIHNMDGAFSKPKQQVNETLPALGKEWSNLEKAEKIYKFLESKKIDTIVDDTDENFSSKMKKFNLIGVPYQIIIGKKSQGDLFEFKEIGKETQNLSIDQISELINKQKEKI